MSEVKHTPSPLFTDAHGGIWRRPISPLYERGGTVAGDKPISTVCKGLYGENEEGYPVEANPRRHSQSNRTSITKFLIRCSSLSSIMADPKEYPRDIMTNDELAALTSKKRTPEQVAMLEAVMARTLSEGAKEHVHKLVKRHLFDYPEPELGSKEVKKGIMQENVAIDLLSRVTGELYTKNEQRFSNDFLTGEPDLLADDHGNDTKCPWSWEQFPLTSGIARKYAIASGYEWQNRGYMLLTGLPKWATSYCMVDTPSELIPPWENTEAHNLHGINIEQRVTQVWFTRDLEIEKRIEQKCRAAQAYAHELIAQFHKEKQQGYT